VSSATAGKALHWVQIGPDYGSYSEASDAIENLDPGVRNTVKVCMDKAQYKIVKKDGGSEEKANTLKTEMSITCKDGELSIVQLPNNHCFWPSDLLRINKRKKASKVQSATKKPPVRIKLAPRFDKNGKSITGKNLIKKTGIVTGNIQKIMPEVTTRVLFSNRDINRITCEGGRQIKDVVYSTEKGIKVKIEGSNAFVKFVMQKKGEERMYVTEPSEFYVVCGTPGTIYSLIGIPERRPAQMIQLSGDKLDNVKKNMSLYKGLTFEKKIMMLMKQAHQGEYPESYEIKLLNKPIKALMDTSVFIVLNREIKIEGEGLLLKEYQLTLFDNFPNEQVQVLEKQFIVPELTNKPIGITLDSLILRKNAVTRLFVLEHFNPTES